MSYNLNQSNGGFESLSAAGLAEGTNANTFKTTATLVYTSDGVFKSKGATDNIPFSAGHTQQAASTTCLYGVFIDAAGNITTSQGPIVPSGDQKPFPTAPAANLTCLGLIQVTTNGSTTFTAGSTDLGAGGVTDAFFDVSRMPSNNF
nr:hypothetical protein 21 [Burkholderiaceae bacterium]